MIGDRNQDLYLERKTTDEIIISRNTLLSYYMHTENSSKKEKKILADLIKYEKKVWLSEDGVNNIINKLKYKCDVGYCIDLEDLEKELVKWMNQKNN